jgi:hypothetical protein
MPFVGLLGPAWCKLFSVIFITLFALHVSDVIHIHPQERHIMYMQMIQVSARARALTCTICMYIIYRSWGWMCITSETCRADSVIKTAQNNLHQAGPNKTHIRHLLWRFLSSGIWCLVIWHTAVRVSEELKASIPRVNLLHPRSDLVRFAWKLCN